jgi:hypothetical protein
VSSGQRRRARPRMIFATRRSSLAANALSIGGRIGPGAAEPEGLQPIIRSGGRASWSAGRSAGRSTSTWSREPGSPEDWRLLRGSATSRAPSEHGALS